MSEQARTGQERRPRLRDLGIVIGTLPTGPWNAITDVPGVRVGYTTLIEGDGPLRFGEGPVRTGVTAIHPHEGSAVRGAVPAAIDVLNGAGEMTGRSQLEESGLLETPIVITNTFSVGTAYRATAEWLARQEPGLGSQFFVIPLVTETLDGSLNDAAGQHVTVEHVFAALDNATNGPLAEGNVGGGTGMTLFGFKGGTGTASRRVTVGEQEYTLGVLVQGNFGNREDLIVAGVPVGLEITDYQPVRGEASAAESPKEGSVIVVIATDAPLSDRQLGRLCRRGMLGLGRVGALGRNTSGDILLAFSNTPENRVNRFEDGPLLRSLRLADDVINPLFQATVEATEEAVLNAMVAAETMTGRDGNTFYGIPHDRLQEVMRRYGRLQESHRAG